jgi:hypothetical protein
VTSETPDEELPPGVSALDEGMRRIDQSLATQEGDPS